MITRTLSHDGLKIHSAGGSFDLLWGAITRVVETRGYISLHSGKMAYYIAVRLIEDVARLGQVRTLVRRHTGDRAILAG